MYKMDRQPDDSECPYRDQVSLNNTNQTNICVMACHYNTQIKSEPVLPGILIVLFFIHVRDLRYYLNELNTYYDENMNMRYKFLGLFGFISLQITG